MPPKRLTRRRRKSGCRPACTPLSRARRRRFRIRCPREPWLIVAAIMTVYIVLGVLYESYIHPITILSTLPSAGVGAILALLLTGNDLGVVAIIGIILLIGIVKKNAIMMIDFALEAERVETQAAGGSHLPGLFAAFPADHDDDHGGAAGRVAAGAGLAARDRSCAIRWASRSWAACWSARRLRCTRRRWFICGLTGWPRDSNASASAILWKSRRRVTRHERFRSLHQAADWNVAADAGAADVGSAGVQLSSRCTASPG